METPIAGSFLAHGCDGQLRLEGLRIPNFSSFSISPFGGLLSLSDYVFFLIQWNKHLFCNNGIIGIGCAHARGNESPMNIDEMYERLVDFFDEYGSGNPRVLVERNIASLMAREDKTEEDAIKSLYEKYENKITKLYAKNKELLEKSVIRAEERKLQREQPKLEPLEPETQETLPDSGLEPETKETLPDSGEVTPSTRTSPLSPVVIFFYIMGTVIILLSFLYLFSIPWDLFGPPWLFLLIWLVSFSGGVTEIAVGWLVDKQFLRKS